MSKQTVVLPWPFTNRSYATSALSDDQGLCCLFDNEVEVNGLEPSASTLRIQTGRSLTWICTRCWPF